MSFIRICENLPVLSIRNFFELDKSLQKKLIEDIFYSKNAYENKKNSPGINQNFPIIKDSTNVLNFLYKKSLEEVEKIFGNINLSKNNSTLCWALCTNKYCWKSVPHDHIKTSTVNLVYYLNIPKINNEYCGKIFFYHDKIWYGYQPECFELLIIPNYLIHDTEYHDTIDWRISINMEITCLNDINWFIK